jgi:outer membrane protein assembly factor BamE (lipoprotein component of BamABCDE complex)
VASWWNVDVDEGTSLQTRYRIADYLALTSRLKDMTRSEVVALLGQPADADKFRSHSMMYVLGPERGLFRIDYEWLAIDLDPTGRVTSVAVVRD